MSDEEDQSNASDDESLSPTKPSKKRDLSDDDLDDDDNEEEEEIRTSQKKKKSKSIMIDDAAVHSGSDDDDEDDDEDDDDGGDNNDYEQDGFVVDDDDDIEIQRKRKRNKSNDLEDSDEDEDLRRRRKRDKSRLQRKREELTDDDIALINEARGIRDPNVEEMEEEEEGNVRSGIKARSARALENQLFEGDDAGGGAAGRGGGQQKKQRQRQADNFDDDGMDDFIDDDVEDVGEGRYRSQSSSRRGEVNEAQINEANEIFGTDFLQFMEGENEASKKYDDEDSMDDDSLDPGRRKKFRERGVGVDLGVDSDDESSDEDEDDLFGSDADDSVDENMTEAQRTEATRLRKEKRKLAKEERRKAAAAKRNERRKARLRKVFEPVQLIENLVTEKDDEIREMDAPERFYDWKTPHYGYSADNDNEISAQEEDEAVWLVGRIPEISAELFAVTSSIDVSMTDESEQDIIENKHREIIDSVAHALRFLHQDKLEPEFIKRYRGDIVTSEAVRNNLHKIMDEDHEWDRLITARNKVQTIIQELNELDIQEELLCVSDESITKLKDQLKQAKDRLDENVQEEQRIKQEIDDAANNDVDEDLFGDDKDDDDDDDEDLFGGENKTKKPKKDMESLKSHLKTSQSLVQVCSEQVATLTSQIKTAEEQLEEQQGSDVLLSKEKGIESMKKICKANIWNAEDLKKYTSHLVEYRHAMDVYSYLKLIKEGNSAIRSKNSASDRNEAEEQKKRSRRFDRDYYRTCVGQGLRSICYKFALSPYRVGMKIDGNISSTNGFNYEQLLPGESLDDDFGSLGGPNMRWSAPKPTFDPQEFASELIGTGELVLLSNMSNATSDNSEFKDPLRGCRYVAALELAHEPRVRKHLRTIYRKHAVFTTRPTAKGLNNIDAFHEFYGLHLLRNKKVKQHFPPDEQEVEIQKMGLNKEDQKELDEKNLLEQTKNCIQYVSILKAEVGGHIKLDIHLPLLDEDPTDDVWYKKDDKDFNSVSKQDLAPLMEELEKVYYPEQGDIDEWNEERRKILKFALTNFLLPQFEVEAKRDLREISTKMAIKSAGQNIYNMAMEGPYRPSHLLGENRFLVPTGDLPIVGVCCSSDGREASFLAAVTKEGEVNDHIAVPAGTQIDGGKMREKVISFLIQTRPCAIMVGTYGGLLSRLVARKLGDMITQATERWNNRNIQGQDEDDDEFEARKKEFEHKYGDGNHDPYDDEEEDDEDSEWKCNIDMVDDNVAQLFGRSVRSKKEFPDMAVNQRCAISIARYAKDPLAELSSTWNVASDTGLFGTEMLYINVHPLQQLLPKHLLLREYERRLCEAVAEVGVDINQACKYDHLTGLLSFVAGMGPRKADNLKSKLKAEGEVSSRKELLAKRLLGPTVYNNAVAFLKIEGQYLKDHNPLDNSRLHPDVYHRNTWAGKIAIDALEMVDEEANSNEKDSTITALRDVMQDSHEEVKRLFEATKAEWERAYGPSFNVGAWDPRVNVPNESWQDKVEELDLDTFAEMIQNNGMGRWHTHLTMIKWEFRLPFSDPRKPMEPVDKDKLFHLLTGESDQTLCPGREVTGKVIRNTDYGSHVKLEGDVPGFIPLRNLADGHVEAAEDVVQIGAVVTAIVTEVKKDHMSVDLSLKKEDMNKTSSEWERPKSLPPIDPCFDIRVATNIEADKLAIRMKRIKEFEERAPGRSGKVTRRACAHPAFRNAKHDEVEHELKHGGMSIAGDAIIRPSTTNPDSLAVHWLVRLGITKMIEISEDDKDTDASIGNILKVKNETYGSIDEFLARYIAPMNDRIDEITSHRKFKDMVERDVDTTLKKMKAQTPNSTFYLLCWSEKYPGYVSLRYIINSVRYHNIGITPDGYVWSKKTYKHIDSVLADFKKYPRGLQVQAPSRSQASVSSSSTRMHSTSEAASTTTRQSRWGARGSSSVGSTMTSQSMNSMSQSNTWGTTPVSTSVNSYSSSMPPPSFPPASNGGWGSQQQDNRPPPPSLPPPPQHHYPPMPPPGAPPGYPPIQR